jgi:hypothetical protein
MKARIPDSIPGEGEIEIREVMEIEDLGEGFTPNPEMEKIKIR